MKHLTQKEDIKFSSINFKEALKLVDFMNMLVYSVNKNSILTLKVETEEYKDRIEFSISTEQAESIYKVLNEIGFESQIDLKKEVDGSAEA